MSTRINHPYHLVDESPWPILSSILAFRIMIGILKWFHLNLITHFLFRFYLLLLVSIKWWIDISRERSYQGLHTSIVELGLRWGIGLFIISEAFFFLSFFWAFFHRRLSPNMEIGITWPPMGIQPFNPFSVPLLNTIILLSSGIRITWRHHRLLVREFFEALNSLLCTILLGMYFTALQGIEYLEAPFRIADSIFGSTFFIATGFHGIHVIVGTLFLLVCYIRILQGKFSKDHHIGFEAASWYWHFVDVIWLILFISIYWWGGNYNLN